MMWSLSCPSPLSGQGMKRGRERWKLEDHETHLKHKQEAQMHTSIGSRFLSVTFFFSDGSKALNKRWGTRKGQIEASLTGNLFHWWMASKRGTNIKVMENWRYERSSFWGSYLVFQRLTIWPSSAMLTSWQEGRKSNSKLDLKVIPVTLFISRDTESKYSIIENVQLRII